MQNRGEIHSEAYLTADPWAGHILAPEHGEGETQPTVIFPDNDEIGRKHADQVAASIYPYVAGLKVVNLSGLADNGDVSDYLQGHSVADLIAEIKKTPQWRPAESPQKLFVSAPVFINQAPQEINWLIEGVIERGANGFFSAVAKCGKNRAAI